MTTFNPGNRYRNPVECDHCPIPATVILGRKRPRYLCETHARPEPVATLSGVPLTREDVARISKDGP